MMRLFCYDQLTNIGGETFFIGHGRPEGGQNGHFLPLLIGLRTKYVTKHEVNSLIPILIEIILAITFYSPV